jgi:hypothetical protein
MEIFNNDFESGFEDFATLTAILESCPDEEKKKEFFKSVLPGTILEMKLQKLVELTKSKKEEDKAELKTLSKSFQEDFEKACK